METRIHPETGKTLYRDVRPIEYTYKGESIIVDQPGWFPANKNDDDGILSQEDAQHPAHNSANQSLHSQISG